MCRTVVPAYRAGHWKTHLKVFCDCLLTKVGTIATVPADNPTSTSCAVPDRLAYVNSPVSAYWISKSPA